MNKVGSTRERYRTGIFGFVVLTAVLFSRPAPEGIALGTMLVLLGLVIRTWSVGYEDRGNHLCTLGPYSMTRHPVVVGNIALTLGVAIATSTWYMALGVLLAGGWVYRQMVATREAELKERFGAAYDRWAEETPLLWPSVANLTLARGTFSWKRIFAREEWLVWVGMLGLIVVLWWIFFLQASGRWWF
ncbi:MAG: hypothetical protein COX57_12265 [Alphaproteobacteria bacterium CG_4_10_14_0_2_um_filter_63_37]|nr:MAG: hypothetical protein AUJ55_09755 [Proteobacteria bacterium CG1_02_64_396]PJA23745.1 MAG: hypothetical protein COX57_12265 [Alphaproteobacteria bacterium CG_4_10_14_0_2_um_filter_63_37]